MIHLFGIRHHGPGSARSLLSALEALQPDLVLIEGPPEADTLVSLALDPALQPPVAVLVHGAVTGDGEPRASFFPFAEFSPEWQALRFGLAGGVPVRFIDLPQAYNLADNWCPPETAMAEAEARGPGPDPDPDPDPDPEADDDTIVTVKVDSGRPDPIALLAQAAGYHDSERFWEHLVEQRPHAGEVFAAIHDAMAAVRAELAPEEGPYAHREACREAWMRQCLRAAEKDGYATIAVICGAWHTPALVELKKTKKDDAALLKPLQKIKTQAAWIPWTHGRLLASSGYGAGIEAPGWYRHLWAHYQHAPLDHQAITVGWLARVAQELRVQGLDASSAQLIDATRLIGTLATLRGRELPDLDDLHEAIISVLHHGNALPIQLSQKLLIGEALGTVPEGATALPIQQDFQRLCKSLRLKPDPESKVLTLDLRQPLDLARSRFLHQLNLLGVAWGRYASGGGRGSFKEEWQLVWQPELSLKLMEAALWGQTVTDAASRYLQHRIQGEDQLPTLAQLIKATLLAALTGALPALIERILALSAHSSEISTLITTLEPLADAWRYSDVRQTSTEALAKVVDSFVTRICIGLPPACASLNDEAAALRLDELKILDRVLARLEDEDLSRQWHRTLLRLAGQQGLHGMLAGWCCRLAQDHRLLSPADAGERFARALSQANSPDYAAQWFGGFLSGQGLALIHDDTLWALVDDWLIQLSGEHFVQVLPLLRRTIATYSLPERQQMAARVGGRSLAGAPATGLDTERARRVLPVAATLFGVAWPG